jgi:hypothetical protein
MANRGASNGQQSIEELQQRFAQLNKRKIQAETSLELAKKQLELLRKEAREKYGTDDLAELQKKLDQMQAENETRRASYQQSLEQIEAELAAVEQKFAESKAPEKTG